MVVEGDKWSLDNTDGEFFLCSKKKQRKRRLTLMKRCTLKMRKDRNSGRQRASRETAGDKAEWEEKKD